MDVFSKFDMTLAISIADEIIDPFIKAEFDELYLVYNQFMNVSVQKPTIVRLFPLPSIGQDVEIEPDKLVDYSMSLRRKFCCEDFFPMYVHVLVFRALLETSAGENGAQWPQWTTQRAIAMR